MKYTIYRKNNPDKLGIAKDIAFLTLAAAIGGEDALFSFANVSSFQKRDVFYAIKDESGNTVYSNHNGQEYFLPETNLLLNYKKVHEIKKLGNYELAVDVINTLNNKVVAHCKKKADLNLFKGIQFHYLLDKSLYSIQLPGVFSKSYAYKIRKEIDYKLFKKWKNIVSFKKLKSSEYTSVLELEFDKKVEHSLLLSIFFVQFMITEGDDGFWENKFED
jgi:hypothetical protein